MNEQVNFCSQCGAKVNSDAKFCLSCGYDLKNSSTKITLDHNVILDKPIKVEVTNVTVEKGFKAIEKTWKPDLETPYMIDDGCPNCGTSIIKEINFNNSWVTDTETCPRCKSPLPEKLKSILRDHSPKLLERLPPQPAHSGMTITEIIKSLVFYILIPVAVLIGIPLLLVFLGSISGNN